MPADVCGPFTLEQLDLFGGNLDALEFSLDSPIWESTTTCVFYVDGNVTADGDVNASVSRTLTVVGDISATGTLSAIIVRELVASGAILAEGDVSASANRIVSLTPSISAQGDVSATVTRILNAVASVIADSVVTAAANAEFSGSGSIEADGMRGQAHSVTYLSWTFTPPYGPIGEPPPRRVPPPMLRIPPMPNMVLAGAALARPPAASVRLRGTPPNSDLVPSLPRAIAAKRSSCSRISSSSAAA